MEKGAFRKDLSEEHQAVLRALASIGESERVLGGVDWQHADQAKLQELLETLWKVERFYAPIGGIEGYHQKVLDLLEKKQRGSGEEYVIRQPEGLDLTSDSTEVRQAVIAGIHSLPQLAEMYPVGGAGERLKLVDQKSGESLPAAALDFCGHSLLEGLIRDLEAREHLYASIYGETMITPVALMTSQEQGNHEKILHLLESRNWFGRPRDYFFLFSQPMVPVVDARGHWVLSEPLVPEMKPGGHGVIWKCARDQGVFAWLKTLQRTHVLVRQINNPMGGIDHALLALTGMGMQPGRALGFASCRRQVQAAEGVNVCMQRKGDKGTQTGITNIEYTEFNYYGLEDRPAQEGSLYSVYPTNTNMIVAKITEIEAALEHLPFPGLLLNMKSTVVTDEGKLACGRLETMMQNIADAFFDGGSHPKSTFITLNQRIKTISVTKKAYQKGRPIAETPRGALYDQCRNAYDLLQHHCGFSLPDVGDPVIFDEEGAPFSFIYHPGLGPLYDVIRQKLRGGKLETGALMRLELTEVDIENLELGGSLFLRGQEPQSARAKLHNVEIPKGVSVEIVLEKDSELVIHDCILKENLKIQVPEGQCAYVNDTETRLGRTQFPTWSWSYSIESDQVRLSPVLASTNEE